MVFLAFALISAVTVIAPNLLITVLIANTAVALFLLLFQLVIALFPKFKPLYRSQKNQPFVSVMVPTYNEPPSILMQALEALSRQRYENYEVLVVDNNTTNPSVWTPIERYTATLGQKIRFIHVEDLEGYKAGAINYGFARVDTRAEYIAVVDADYVVEPDFLRTAMSYFIRRDIALVQFPQKHRNVNDSNQPIADEYRHFFEVYMNMANHLDCVPSTGTVSVYRVDALRNINGFRTHSITEDADAGLRIRAAGFSGVYVDRPVGYGLMPYDLEAYRKQKERWSYGNAQSIVALFSLFGKLPLRSWFGFLSHLTAWHHFNFLPFAVLAGSVFVLTPFIPATDAHMFLFSMASIVILATLLTKFVLLLSTLQGKKHFFVRAVKALAVHMGMTLLYSEVPVAFLFGRKLRFERTNKFLTAETSNLLMRTYKETFLGAWLLLGAMLGVVYGGEPEVIVALLVSSLALFSSHYIYWSLRSTRSISRGLLRDVDRTCRQYFVTLLRRASER